MNVVDVIFPPQQQPTVMPAPQMASIVQINAFFANDKRNLYIKTLAKRARNPIYMLVDTETGIETRLSDEQFMAVSERTVAFMRSVNENIFGKAIA